MGQAMGLSWIFCVKRVFGFGKIKCYFLPKAFALRKKSARTHIQNFVLCGFLPSHTLIKKQITNVICSFMGRVMGFEPMHIGTTIRGLNHLTILATSFLLFNFQTFVLWSLFLGTVNLYPLALKVE